MCAWVTTLSHSIYSKTINSRWTFHIYYVFQVCMFLCVGKRERERERERERQKGHSKGRAAGATARSATYRGVNLVINGTLNLFVSIKRAPFLANTCKKGTSVFRFAEKGRLFLLRPVAQIWLPTALREKKRESVITPWQQQQQQQLNTSNSFSRSDWISLFLQLLTTRSSSWSQLCLWAKWSWRDCQWLATFFWRREKQFSEQDLHLDLILRAGLRTS